MQDDHVPGLSQEHGLCLTELLDLLAVVSPGLAPGEERPTVWWHEHPPPADIPALWLDSEQWGTVYQARDAVLADASVEAVRRLASYVVIALQSDGAAEVGLPGIPGSEAPWREAMLRAAFRLTVGPWIQPCDTGSGSNSHTAMPCNQPVAGHSGRNCSRTMRRVGKGHLRADISVETWGNLWTFFSSTIRRTPV